MLRVAKEGIALTQASKMSLRSATSLNLADEILREHGHAWGQHIDDAVFKGDGSSSFASRIGLSHITGAMNINVQHDSFGSMAAGLDKDQTYLVHGTKNPDGARSSRALDTLQSLGFKNLYNLEGGYIAWKEAELPLTEAGN